MEFDVREIGADAAVVGATGRLNMVSAPAFRETVAGVVAAGRTRIAIDLSGIEFMDSSGLGALVGCLKTARQAGGDLRIASPTKQVLMVLQLSNIDRILKPYDDPQAALEQ